MSQRMYWCSTCRNKVRTLYEWKGADYCGMCQQENIEKYETTLCYRLRLSHQLTRNYIQAVFGQVFFPYRGLPRRFLRSIGAGSRGFIYYVSSKVRKTAR